MEGKQDLWPARLTVRYSDPGDKAYLECGEDLSEVQWSNAAAAGLMMRVYEDSTPEFQAELLGGCWAAAGRSNKKFLPPDPQPETTGIFTPDPVQPDWQDPPDHCEI